MNKEIKTEWECGWWRIRLELGETFICKMVEIPGCLYPYGDNPEGATTGTVDQKKGTLEQCSWRQEGVRSRSQTEGLASNRVYAVGHQYYQAGCLNVCTNAAAFWTAVNTAFPYWIFTGYQRFCPTDHKQNLRFIYLNFEDEETTIKRDLVTSTWWGLCWQLSW